MGTLEILRNKPANRVGYMPSSVAVSTMKVEDLRIYRKLMIVPSKITAYFHRDKIKEIFKTDFNSLDDDYYLIRASDDTIFHVEY